MTTELAMDETSGETSELIGDMDFNDESRLSNNIKRNGSSRSFHALKRRDKTGGKKGKKSKKTKKRSVNPSKNAEAEDIISPSPSTKKKVTRSKSNSSAASTDLSVGGSSKKPRSQKSVSRSMSFPVEGLVSPSPRSPRKRGVNRNKSSAVGSKELKSPRIRPGVDRSKSTSSMRKSKVKDALQRAGTGDRRATLKKEFSWWDLSASSVSQDAAAVNGRLSIMDSDSDDEPPPPPKPPSFRTPGRSTPSQRSKRLESSFMSSSTHSLNPNALQKPATVNRVSSIDEMYGYDDDSESNDAGGNTSEVPTHIQETPSQPSSYGTLDSPSSSSIASSLSAPLSTKSLSKYRLRGDMSVKKIASIGELFDAGREEESDSDGSTSSNSTSKQVTWIELPLENPADVVIKAINEENDLVESSTVPAGSALLDNLSDDLQQSLCSIKERMMSGSAHAAKTTPSLGETIGRDKRSVEPRALDESTINTGASEQTTKTTNRIASHPAAPAAKGPLSVTDAVPESGFQNLKKEEEDQRSDNGSSRSRRSIPSQRSTKFDNNEEQNAPSSNGRRFGRRVNRRRSMGAVSYDTTAGGNPRRRRQNRRGSIGSLTNHQNLPSDIDTLMPTTDDKEPSTPNDSANSSLPDKSSLRRRPNRRGSIGSLANHQNLPSDIDTFMTMADDKEPSTPKDSANSSLKSSHSTVSTSTISTMNSEHTRPRGSTLQNIQLTF